ncbi:MAG: ribosome-associated translation inhibitor RaiA [Acidimicrobiia bacterium]|nr:ribosome-associated translation inhibitor RaiA [Acidimicrobiia bacterium]MBT8214813.1 ribosome-associated translation inhibitor RaiA [Acidimicrobiia bacterium]NNF68314.1 ribosome-associated translation inhibitor RaiA [Acidimicrobiia bacterium]
MQARVHGKNMHVEEDLRELVTEKIENAGRIWGDAGTADVEFTASNNPRNSDGKYRVEITTSVSGHLVRVESNGHDERTAFDRSMDVFERQLRRLKERTIQRSRTANKRLNPSPEPSDEEDTGAPRIVRTKRFAMKPMMPEEAIMQMEMLGHEFYFFLNAESDAYCVIYRRRDGSIGLIEPT